MVVGRVIGRSETTALVFASLGNKITLAVVGAEFMPSTFASALLLYIVAVGCGAEEVMLHAPRPRRVRAASVRDSSTYPPVE